MAAMAGYEPNSGSEEIPSYPAPCPIAPYRRSNTPSLTGYRSIFRTRSGFGPEESERMAAAADTSVMRGDPDGTHWHPDQRFGKHDSINIEGLIREGETEWLKMLNRTDLTPRSRHGSGLVTSQIPKQDPKPAPVPNVEVLGGFPKGPPLHQGQHPVVVKETVDSQAPAAPYRPFEENNRTDEYYRRYLQLSSNVAFRHPNPGLPRERQGAIGGSWRHIKEVLGYRGGQVCFVDGLVRLYDTDAKHFSVNQSAGMRAAMATPAYAPNRHNVAGYNKEIQRSMEQRAYKPWDDSRMPAISTTPRQAMASGNSKYKGFYTYRQ